MTRAQKGRRAVVPVDSLLLFRLVHLDESYWAWATDLAVVRDSLSVESVREAVRTRMDQGGDVELFAAVAARGLIDQVWADVARAAYDELRDAE